MIAGFVKHGNKVSEKKKKKMALARERELIIKRLELARKNNRN